MSFSSEKEVINEGDTVILYLSASSMHAFKVSPTIKNKHGDTVDNVFQTTYGALKVASLIGVKYGSKVELTRGWAYVLQPTPELWTLTLPHRTQIIYTPDVSLIVHHLELEPGSVVVESGTGSGSLTHALVRRIQPSGHVFTFDFHDARVASARDEFEAHGLSANVTVDARDVCREGFGPGVAGRADAVFLDLPHPWTCVSHAVSALKGSGGRFGSFSPCIEQVQRTCTELRELGFVEVLVLECLQREITVCTRKLGCMSLDDNNSGDAMEEDNGKDFIATNYSATMPGHTGYLTLATLPPVWVRNRIATSNNN